MWRVLTPNPADPGLEERGPGGRPVVIWREKASLASGEGEAGGELGARAAPSTDLLVKEPPLPLFFLKLFELRDRDVCLFF